MFCPFKMANPELTPHYMPEAGCSSERDWGCERDYCALWNERFGQCSLVVDAYLKGQADIRAERGMKD